MRRSLTLAFLPALLSACSALELPQTPDEFRQLVVDHPGVYAVSTHVSNQRFESVMSSVERSARECLNFNRRQTRTQGGVPAMAMQDAYRTNLRRLDNDHATLTMQEKTTGAIQVQKVPPGGMYQMVVDIERLTANTTNVTFYGYRDTRFRAFIEQAADGQSVPCPV